MNPEPSNAKQPWGGRPKVAGTDKTSFDWLFIPPMPRLSNTNLHSVDAYAFRIGAALVTYFPETDQFGLYKYLEKIRTNPAWIPLKGSVPRLLSRRKNTYLIKIFPRSAEWLDGVLAIFREENLQDEIATTLLVEIEEELSRNGGISNGN
jgi:hypothetical protein